MGPHDLALAYALSTIAGLRASLTIAAVSLAIHLHWIGAPPGLGWLAADATLAIAAVLAVADLLGDKIPVVDHALHAVHVVLAPLAGGTAALAVDPSSTAPAAVALTVFAGANSLGIHGLRTAARGASSALTFGALNPLVSLIEDGLAVAALGFAFVAPVAVAAVALVLTVAALIAVRRVLAATRGRRIAAAGERPAES